MSVSHDDFVTTLRAKLAEIDKRLAALAVEQDALTADQADIRRILDRHDSDSAVDRKEATNKKRRRRFAAAPKLKQQEIDLGPMPPHPANTGLSETVVALLKETPGGIRPGDLYKTVIGMGLSKAVDPYESVANTIRYMARRGVIRKYDGKFHALKNGAADR